jgi:pyruvate dehydrogenase E1 component alpha subunit
MPGTIHLYQGQEAVGVCENLRKEDVITSTHRPHGHAIAKGVPLKSIMAELFAQKTPSPKPEATLKDVFA